MAEHHLCPVWIGYLLASPVRKLSQNPRKILGPYVNEGMTVADIGCAMGFFSLPLAKQSGFTVKDTPQIKRSRAVLLQKKP